VSNQVRRKCIHLNNNFLSIKIYCAIACRGELVVHYIKSVSLLILAFAFPLQADAQINRAVFFNKCGEIVDSKKSFRAMDRGQMRTFYLRSTVMTGEGKVNIGRILDYIEKIDNAQDKRQIAYVLGTAYRETMSTMMPIHEAPGCKTEACIHKNVGAYGQPDKDNRKSYYGRGFVQLTHADNYKKFGKVLGFTPDTILYETPDLALQPEYAVPILVEGMYRGYFTSKKLDDYFGKGVEDWNGARQIVNPGSKRAPVTAGYAKLFYECLGG
jgi:hypothetical protein